MYRKHFALTRHPFDKDLAADDLFESASLAELGARLRHLVDMRGIGLVTGDSGSGKTTTCRRLVAGLHTGLYRVLYVSMTTGNVMDLYKSIAWELGLPTERNRAALFRQIRGEVSRLCAENRLRPVLIVDEAHLVGEARARAPRGQVLSPTLFHRLSPTVCRDSTVEISRCG